MALIALGLALLISRIYATNMTLMLHPEAWQKLYAESAFGAHLPGVDAALTPRWLFMLVGGLSAGGLWMIWLAGRTSIEQGVRTYLSGLGGRLAAVALLAQIFLAYQVCATQSESIRGSLGSNLLFQYSAFVWLAGAGLLAILAAWCGTSKATSRWPGWAILVVGVVAMLAMTTCRDVLRDVTLKSYGFDVWNRTVNANWPVIVVFLGSFVAGLGCVAWLISVVLRAKPTVEKIV